MVFSSYVFILLFLPLTLIGYRIVSKCAGPIWRKCFLTAASLFFYGWYNWRYLALMLLSILVNYGLCLLMDRYRQRRLFFLLGVLFNLFLLGYFKYWDFFAGSLSAALGLDYSLRHIALPLGISFFSFQQISYLLSFYRRELDEHGFADYCLYITFFPKLVMGPLAEPRQLIPQFREASRSALSAENIAGGLYLFAIGLFKKAVISDSLALFVNNGFAMASPGLAASWCASLGYTMQLYFDFSGYSDMALGVALMFNIRLPINFDSPYKSESISQFWRRWHISLGRTLSGFIYRPLGGSRCSLGRTCLNLFATMLISGLWHGAAWTFVLWGALHGLIMVFERLFASVLSRIPRLIRRLGTFLAVNFLWVLFRAESWQQAMGIYKGMLSFSELALYQLQTIAFDGNINNPAIIDIALVLGALLVCCALVFCTKNSNERLESFSPRWGNVLSTVLMLAVSMLCLTRETVFIYFNF